MTSGKASKELLQMDLYGLLGVEPDATGKQIKKAYRQKALTCHPDKNPDNPRAAELFHQLSQALEVLTDGAAKAAYDNLRKAKEAAAKRTHKLDEKRKKVKLDLEAREREAQTLVTEEDEAQVTRTLEQEIIRLREEGSRQLEEQQRLVREQIKAEMAPRLQGQSASGAGDGTVSAKLKLKWKCKKDDDTRGGYTEDVLRQLLQKYGQVTNLLVSSKKGSAIAEFSSFKAAEMAVRNESGLLSNPLTLSWLDAPPPSTIQENFSSSYISSHSAPLQGSVRSERDFESLVMMKMRQAAERQRLIEQMQREDDD
ncbi:DnaJ heat shock protein family (Hsp40) member C17 S homeolog [Xenopus laevis]|uniref:DnaJ homolog subfamily C member 17 n=1 Tax=Xenopus laevis TaxID=8355 RepID=Q6PCH3_XENLA|nr:DnaJ heat shock protein family (Hsp40) member C17 S homeolog [Xenopus laevis]AAH59326.1 MGC69064 protein [Xenopus laevis]